MTLMCIPDTDSIKCLLPIEELKQFCDIDDVKLGAWKNEGVARYGKFIRQKCYLEEFAFTSKNKRILTHKRILTNKKYTIKGYTTKAIHITCAGMPKSCYNQVNWNDFQVGFTCEGKLTFKNVKGGVILVDTDFTIKPEKTMI